MNRIESSQQLDAESSGTENDLKPHLWNPDVAGLWSLLFSPVFGSYLVLKNWQTIGDTQSIRTAKIWFIVSIVMLVPIFLVPGAAVAFIYIIIWYFGSQKKQTKYVKKHWGKSYNKRSWLKPIGIALSIFVAIILIFSLLVFIFPDLAIYLE